MGLDMYLHGKKYLSAYSFAKEEDKQAFATIVSSAGLEKFTDRDTPSLTVSVTVAYWRKVNAVHQWFVENVQGGTDDCGPYGVSREDLGKLVDACKEAIALYKNGDKDGAGAVLTPTAGFFFGSTDVDDDYLADLEDTVRQLTPLLSAPPELDFEYQSSW